MPEASVRSSGASAAMADPILRDPVAFASFKQLDIDPSLYAENIVLDADTTKEIESSGGWNLVNSTTTARGVYQITRDTLPTLLQQYLNTASEEGIDLPAWALEAADAYTESAITKDNLPKLLQSFMNQKFADGEEIPQWALDFSNAKEVSGDKAEEWHDKGISHFVGSSVGDISDLTEAQRKELTPKSDKLMRGKNSITDPMDLEPWQQRVLYANGKNRSIKEDGDEEIYRQAVEQGDTDVFTDIYMDHWHRGNRFTEAQLNAMPDGGARVRNEIEKARARATEKYTEAQPGFQSYTPQPVEPAESGREPATSIMARQAEQEYATPDLTTYINAGMLSEITDLPSRRGGGEILNEAVVPQRRGRFPEVSVPQRGGRFPEVTPTQRGQIPIPQPRQPGPAPTPQLTPVDVPQRSGRFPEMQARSSRVDPTPPELPQLEEVVPTQRGQVPIPKRPVEADEDPIELEDIADALTPVKVDASKVDTTYERKAVPEKVEQVADSYDDFLPDSAGVKERRKAERDAIDDRKMYQKANDYDEFLPESELRSFSDSYIGTELARGARTVAQGLSAGTSDELEAGITALFSDTPYADARANILQDLQDQRTLRPTTALFQDIAGGVLGGGALVSQMVKRGSSVATAGALEGGLMGAGYGEGVEGKLAGTAGFAAFGGTLGRAVDWATTPSSKAMRSTKEGGRTQADDIYDEETLTVTLKNDLQPGNTVIYKTPEGALKDVEVISVQDDFVFVRDGRYQIKVPYEDISGFERTGRSPLGALGDAEKEGQYQYVKAGPGGRYQQKQFSYLEEAPIQEAKTKPRQKVLRAKRNEDGSYSLMPSGKVEWELQDLTWRNAKTAGEFFDGTKYLLKDFYDQKLTPASDYVMRNVAPRVGAIFQRYSESALRQNTIAFKTIMEPMERLIKAMDDDKKLKALVMDYTNQRNLINWNMEVARARAAIGDSQVRLRGPLQQTVTTREQLLEYIAKEYGNDQAIAFNKYLDWNRGKKGEHVGRLSGVQEFTEDSVEHIHTRKMRKNPEDEPDDIFEELAMRDDDALEGRSRLSMIDDLADSTTPDKVDRYFNPLLTDFRRTSNLEVLNQMARLFNLKRPAPGSQPTAVFDELYQTLISRGLSEEKAKIAINAMKDDFIGQSKTPNNWLQFLNSWGYAGSLAGPKSALLNLHDVPMAAVIYGPGSFKGVFKKLGYSVEDKGVVQRVGEFQNYVNEQMSLGAKDLSKQLADLSRKGTDKLMTYSAFGWTDTVGKDAITRMIIQDAVDNVDDLSARWGFYFSRSELDTIAKQIRKHGTDVTSYTGKGAELMEELFFAGLGQQQLISSAGRPLAWSRNPNMRFMWALRGFAMKQLALAHRNIIDNIAQGNNKAAWDYMKRYALWSAGSFGLLNESRQWMWGDGEFTAGGVIMGMADQIVSTASINTIGLNDYQWGKMMQEGVAITAIKSLEPLMTSVPRGNLGDFIDALDGEFKNNKDLNIGQRVTLVPSQFPLIKQWSNSVKNIEEDIGVIPNPMAQFNKVYIQQEQSE